MVKSDYDSFLFCFCQNNHEGFYAWCAVWEQKVVGQFLTQSPRSMHFALLFMYSVTKRHPLSHSLCMMSLMNVFSKN